MKVLVATVGGSEGPVITAARKLGLDKAVLITGKPAKDVLSSVIEGKPDPLEVAESIRRKLEKLGAGVEVVPVNPFDFQECCLETLKVLERLKGNEVFVAVSGGTKIQALAASYAAFLLGCRMFYVQELKDGSELVEIPLNFKEFDELSEARREVLRVFGTEEDAVSVAEKLKISRKTASQYLRELREYGLIEPIEGRGRKRYRLTFAGRLCRVRWCFG